MTIKHFERLYETLQDLRKDYKRLAIKNHPDMGGNANELKTIYGCETINSKGKKSLA